MLVMIEDAGDLSARKDIPFLMVSSAWLTGIGGDQADVVESAMRE